MRKEGVVLEDGVHPALVGWESVQAFATHPEFAACGLFEAGDQTQQRCFAGATFPEERKEFSCGDFERDVLQNFARTEMLSDVADFEQDISRSRACQGLLRSGTRLRHGAAFTSFQISMYFARRATSCQK